MFTRRLRLLADQIGAAPSDLARGMHCDRSYLSRLFSGGRVPKAAGKSARKLADALCRCADEKGTTERLCALIGSNATGDALRADTAAWLYESTEQAPLAPRGEKRTYRSFGQKLGALMDLTGLSNIRFGKLLNTDPSYISRFRNGFRSPRANTNLTNEICRILLDRIYEQNKTDRLAALMRCPQKSLALREEAEALFLPWLTEDETNNGTPFVEGLVEGIGADFAVSEPAAFPPITTEAPSEIYYGADGLRRAVIRFLLEVIERKAKKIYLYSDQKIDWMVSDATFRAQWTALMLRCLHSGTEIRVIHNVDRNFDEMATAIRAWMPFYFSGLIRSYYGKGQKNARFSVTTFLCPQIACVSGGNVAGTENEIGVYRYDTDPDLLNVRLRSFDDLLSRSGKLAYSFLPGTEWSGLPIESGATLLNTTLSLASMPEATLRGIADRIGVSGEKRALLLQARAAAERRLRDALRHGFAHECLPLPHREETPIDLPGITAFYTPKEYAEHLRGMIALAEQNVGYRLYPLPEAVFADIQVLITDSAVAVHRKKDPCVTVRLEHPEICRAFVAYAERIKEQYRRDKQETKQQLEACL